MIQAQSLKSLSKYSYDQKFANINHEHDAFSF